jgi:hydrogenase expression/formation protein HypE
MNTAKSMKLPERIELAHGSGGRAMQELIEQVFQPAFANPWLAQQNDAACVEVAAGRMVITTDAHVITPLFFPGGDIGSLAVHGTINDVAMLGARPLYLTAGFIVEEGFAMSQLQAIVTSMASAAHAAGVAVVAGDTKVVNKGCADGVFITTTGVGMAPPTIHISGDRARAGDHILLSGDIGDHGIAIMAQRENLEFSTQVTSDSAALHDLVAQMVAAVSDIHCLRDPTRGGLATTLNELARQSQVGMCIDETSIPCKTAVRSACELLGLDPLYVANEGKLVAICDAKDSDRLLSVMRRHPLGQKAAVIGEVTEDPRALVQMRTLLGGKRLVDWLAGEQLPRIC